MWLSLVALIPLLAVAVAPADSALYDVPEGAVVEHLFEGPNDSVVAFYFDPLPASVFCAVGLGDERRELRRVAAFDSEGRLLWRARLPTLRVLQAARVLPDTSVVIWGFFRAGGGLPADTLVVRVSGAGAQRMLTRSDIGAAVLTSVDVAEDGAVVVAGTFSAIRGQPRAGLARLRKDGSLDD